MAVNTDALARTLALTPHEREIFEYLLEYQTSLAATVRKMLHLDRTSFYRSLTNLENKSLITITGKLREQVISLNNLDNVKSYLQAQQSEIASAQKSLYSLQHRMKLLRDDRYQRDNIKIFSGPRAFMQAMDATLLGGGKIFRDLTPDSRAVYELAGGEQAYLEYIHDFKARRIAKQVTIRILLDQKAKHLDSLDSSNKADLKEVRQFSGNLKLDCFLNTCGNRTLFYTKDESGSWGLVIKDELITKLLNTLFDLIWTTAKVVGTL